jgi:hypothetical protein
VALGLEGKGRVAGVPLPARSIPLLDHMEGPASPIAHLRGLFRGGNRATCEKEAGRDPGYYMRGAR